MRPLLYLFALTVFIWSGCSKDTDTLHPDPFFPGQATYTAPLFIEVMTADGLRIRDAKINLGNTEAYTDASGLVYLEEALVGESAYLTVEKEGFFHASRRFYPAPGKAQYLRIMLLPDSRIAFFNAKDGAVLPVEDHAIVHFPSHGYVLGNGDTYEGIVVVSAKPISADDPDLSFKMPGDLVGVNSAGSLGALGSFGMIAVEMKTSSGEKVLFKEGTGADIEMIIPSSMADDAPATIPFWYFDEYDGVWKEEGVAVKSGDRYIGKVSHFSFWNCDAWFETVQWGAAFSYEDGSPASQVKVCMTIESLGVSRCDYTDASGTVRGMVAAGEVLSLNVYGKCDQEIYGSNIGPYSMEHFLGPISISDPTAQSHVSGIAVDCQLKPLTNGYVKISTGNTIDYIVPDVNTGAFDAVVTGCTSGNILVYAYNNEENKFSIPLSVPFAAAINVDTLFTCGFLEEYAQVRVEGFPDFFLFEDLTFRSVNGEGYSSIISENTDLGSFYISYEGEGQGIYLEENSYILIKLGDGTYGYSYNVRIEVTQYGGVGEYVKGNVTGILYTSQNLNEPHFPFEADFSVLREE